MDLVFIPKRLLKRSQRGQKLYLMGLLSPTALVIVDSVEEHTGKALIEDAAKLPIGLKICGLANCSIPNQNLSFRLDMDEKYPLCSKHRTIVTFEPPNFRNLEYFSISHILLQSTGSVNITTNPKLLDTLAMVEPPPTPIRSTLTDDEVLDSINQCHMIREKLHKYLLKNRYIRPKVFIPNFLNFVWNELRLHLIRVLVIIIWSIEKLTIWMIWLLNYKVYNMSLVTISQAFRQLEVRMRQINYFPVQFLCYYNKEYLYDDKKIVSSLQIPLKNKNLNVNNSNYINLFNSLWMILNDVILGITFWRVIEPNLAYLASLFDETIIIRTLDHDLYNLVSWVSFNHPAGFKLNNELGLFMGNMFLWSLKVWQEFISSGAIYSITGSISRESVGHSRGIIERIIQVLCFCGFSFFLGAVADLTNIITFHIYCCYYSSTRIFNRQVNTIKSLCQLFRGKKYNVLRKRVDNLDNYSKVPAQYFEIDQMLVGTLMFIVLVLLLPTIFAFYVTFFCVQMVKLGIMNLIESILIVLNFLPLFVVILKLKNSNRLQGGVHLSFMGQSSTTNYLDLSNKTLTYQEIFADFLKLFRNKNAKKRTKLTVLLSFFAGEPISFTYNDDLRINYLMLPRNYQNTASIWEGIIAGSERQQPKK